MSSVAYAFDRSATDDSIRDPNRFRGIVRPYKESDVERLRGELPQTPETDLRYDLCGVEVVWRSKAGGTSWPGWKRRAA